MLTIPRKWSLYKRCLIICSPGRSRSRLHVAAAVRRAKSSIKRKDLQHQVQVEYIKSIYEDAQKIEGGQLVIELKDATPKELAEERQQQQLAALNQRLGDEIAALGSWQQALQLLQQHGSQLNYVNIGLMCHKLALLHAAGATPAGGAVTGSAAAAVAADGAGAAAAPAAAAGAAAGEEGEGHQGEQQQFDELLALLADAVQRRMGWFRSHHFEQVAAGLGACGLRDQRFWSCLVREMERKLMALSASQLANILASLGAAGYVPSRNWLERTERQAAKHLHRAGAADLSNLLWAWGQWCYTPQKMFASAAWHRARASFKRHAFSGQQLVRLMHGIARMAAHQPREPWLLAFAGEVSLAMHELAPSDIVEVLAALVSLGLRPPERWLQQALGQLQQRGFASYAGIAGAAGDAWQVLGGSQAAAAAGELQGQQGQDEQELEEAAAAAAASSSSWLGRTAEQLEERLTSNASASTSAPAAATQESLSPYQAQAPSAAAAAAASKASAQQRPAEGDGLEQLRRPEQEEADAEQLEQGQLGAVVVWDPASPAAQAALQQALRRPLALDELALLGWCLDQLDSAPPADWMEAYLAELHAWLPRMHAHHVGDILLAIAGLSCQPEESFVEAYLQRAQQLMPQLPAAALAGVLRALSLLNYEPEPDWGAAALARCEQVLHDMSPAELADTLASLAYLCVRPSEQLLAAVEARSAEQAPQLQPQKLAALLQGFALLGYKPAGTWLQLALACLQHKLKFLEVRDLASVAWALATLKHRPSPTWLEAYMLLLLPKLPHMPARCQADVAWALASFGCRPNVQWSLRLAQAAGKRLGEFEQGDLAVLLWALGQFRLLLGPEHAPLLSAAQHRLTGGSSGGAGTGLAGAALAAEQRPRAV